MFLSIFYIPFVSVIGYPRYNYYNVMPFHLLCTLLYIDAKNNNNKFKKQEKLFILQ